MSNQLILEDFKVLPPNAQREVVDFIDFLKTRYVEKNEEQQQASLATPIEKEAFIGMWKNRKDLVDSKEWVKQLRENDWK